MEPSSMVPRPLDDGNDALDKEEGETVEDIEGSGLIGREKVKEGEKDDIKGKEGDKTGLAGNAGVEDGKQKVEGAVEKRDLQELHAWYPELGCSASPKGSPLLLDSSPLHTLLTTYSPDKIWKSTIPCNQGIGREIVYPAMLVVTRKPMQHNLWLYIHILSCHLYCY